MFKFLKIVYKNLSDYLFFTRKVNDLIRLYFSKLYYLLSIFVGWVNFFKVIFPIKRNYFLKFLYLKIVLIPLFIMWIVCDTLFFKIFIPENLFDAKMTQYRKEYGLKKRYIPLFLVESVFFILRPFWRFFNTFIILISMIKSVIYLIYLEYFEFFFNLLKRFIKFIFMWSLKTFSFLGVKIRFCYNYIDSYFCFYLLFKYLLLCFKHLWSYFLYWFGLPSVLLFQFLIGSIRFLKAFKYICYNFRTFKKDIIYFFNVFDCLSKSLDKREDFSYKLFLFFVFFDAYYLRLNSKDFVYLCFKRKMFNKIVFIVYKVFNFCFNVFFYLGCFIFFFF